MRLRQSATLLGAAAAAHLLLTPACADELRCKVPELQSKAGRDVTIVDATLMEAKQEVPAHCLVNGKVTTPGNEVSFRLGLPQTWNGKFLFLGVGGFAGSFARLDSGLERGYATATTDTGHQGGGTDGSWALNSPAKEIDYGHRGTHVTAVASQQLTRSYFGKAASYAYFNGCSNGGRQALMEAQRYPQDFDGIVAGDPSLGTLGYVRRALNYQFMLAAPERVLSPQKLEVVSKAVVAACDARDGATDGLIGDPRLCNFDPDTLRCPAEAATASCLTTGELATLKFLYSDVPAGDKRMYGLALGHEAGETGWPQWQTGRVAPTARPDGKLQFSENAPAGYRFADGYFQFMAFEQDDPSYDWRNFDVQRDLGKIAGSAQRLDPSSADLSKFAKRRGKLLMYHGWADPGISPYGSIAYYERVVAASGGQRAADDFVRLFMVPGMHHCRGGPGADDFDSLGALEQWVEQGKAPAQMIARHSSEQKGTGTRLLCPEPQVARYTGTGSVQAAESYRCAAPKTQR